MVMHLSSTSPAPFQHLSSTSRPKSAEYICESHRICCFVCTQVCMKHACRHASRHLSSTSPAPRQHLSSTSRPRGVCQKVRFWSVWGPLPGKKSAKYNGDSQPEIQIRTPLGRLRGGCGPGPWRGVGERETSPQLVSSWEGGKEGRKLMGREVVGKEERRKGASGKI